MEPITSEITIYDRPSIRLRRPAFVVRIGEELTVVKKRWVKRAGWSNKSLMYKVQTKDGRIGWIGPMFRLPHE